MIGQRGIKTESQGPPIRYDAIDRRLATLAVHALRLNASVHMPLICGPAGGTWDKIELIIVRTLCERNVLVTVYDFD